MAEVKDRESLPAEQAKAPAAGTHAAASSFTEEAAVPKKKKKNKKKIIRRAVALAVVAALAGGGFFAWKKLHGGGENEQEILTDMVSRGSITSVVEGSGAAVAKNSASVTLLSAGQVREILVAEGDYVTKGTQLFNIDSKEAQDAYDNARERVRDAERHLADQEKALKKYLDKAIVGDVKAEYSGILIDLKDGFHEGDDVSEKEVFGTLADNTVMLLPLYFSYAYENDISVGQSATVSVPVTMAQLAGRVHEIHKVDYVTGEGGRMFEVVIAVDNPGTLTKDMEATATVTGAGETIYPYQSGKLDYLRTTELKAPLTGKLTWHEAYKWQKLAEGESIAHIEKDTEDREDELRNLNNNVTDARKSLDEAQKTLEKEEKNLNSLSATSPIDGTVLSIGIKAGEEAASGTVAVSIADMTTMKIETQVDEMYVRYVRAGMPVDLKLGETEMIGTVDSVSLSAKSENGVARFPMVILVDNSEELLRSGAYIDYSFTASQSDDCLLVPIQCIKSAQTIDGENCKMVYVQSDEPLVSEVELDTSMMTIPDGFQPVYVEVGISDNRNTEILSGVDEGMIVYAGTTSSDGMGMMF